MLGSSTFDTGKSRVFNFMQQVQQDEIKAAQDQAYKNSDHYKNAIIRKEQETGKSVCLDAVFAKLYKDATPLSDDYKVAHGDDLDVCAKDFFAAHAPKGMDYYVRDAAKQGNVVAQELVNGIDNIIAEEYDDKLLHPENYSADDMKFTLTGEIEDKIDSLSNNMQLDGLSDIIKDNVKRTAMSEIIRAKEEKESNKRFEDQLTNDMSITTQAAIESAVSIRNALKPKIYQPTLFEGMMIGFSNRYNTLQESGITPDTYDYGSMDIYTENVTDMNPCMVYAFTESIKEMTGLHILKALKLDKSLNRLNRVNELAYEYANMK